MDEGKLTDAELLAQLACAAQERSCSISYALQSAYKLGLAQGQLEQAQIAVETVKGAI